MSSIRSASQAEGSAETRATLAALRGAQTAKCAARQGFSPIGTVTIWSPNSPYAPAYFGQRSLFLRADRTFGPQDFGFYPQMLHPDYMHFVAIPVHPGLRHLHDPNFDITTVADAEWRMFDVPMLTWFEPAPDKVRSVHGEALRLKEARAMLALDDMKALQATIKERYRPEETLGLVGDNLALLYHSGVLRLVEMSGDFDDLAFCVRDVQRFRLELIGYIDYYKWYLPGRVHRPAGEALEAPAPATLQPVLGAFLPAEDLAMRKMLVEMGIPAYVVDKRDVQTVGADAVVKLSEAKGDQRRGQGPKFNEIAETVCMEKATQSAVQLIRESNTAAYALAIHNSSRGLLHVGPRYSAAQYDQTTVKPASNAVSMNLHSSAFNRPDGASVPPLAALIGTPAAAQYQAPVTTSASRTAAYNARVTIDPATEQAIFHPWSGASSASGPSGSQPPAKRARIGGPATPSSSSTTESHGARYALVYRPIWVERRDVLRSAAEAGFAATSKNAKKRLDIEGKDTGPVVLEATLHHVFPPAEHLAADSTVEKIECFALNARALVPLILAAIQIHGLLPSLAFTRNVWRTVLSGAWKDAHSRPKKAKDDIKKADRALGLRTLANGRRLKDAFVNDAVLLGDIPGLPSHLSEDDIREIAWAVNEYNVRADLILADNDLWRAPSPYTSPNALQDRMELRRSVFADGALLPHKLDVVRPRGLVARGVERFASLVALRDLVLGWPPRPRAAAFGLYPASGADPAATFAGMTEQAHLDFEAAVVDAYVGAFLARFTRIPAMPAIPPQRLAAPSAAAPSTAAPSTAAPSTAVPSTAAPSAPV